MGKPTFDNGIPRPCLGNPSREALDFRYLKKV